MTYYDDFTLSASLLEQLTADGLEALPTLFPVLLNASARAYPGAHGPCQRLQRQDPQYPPGTDYRRRVPGAGGQRSGRRLLPAVARAWNPLRTRSEASPGRNVCAGRLHPQSRGDHT